MNSLFLSSKLCVLFLGLVYNLPLLCSAASSNATLYKSCGTAFSCGTNLSKFGYPFWGGARPRDCGYPGLELTCRDTNVTIIKIMGLQYQVLGINENDQTINILREDLSSDGICPRELVNTTLDFSLFDYTDSINITILYGCPSLGYGYGYDPTQITCSLKGSNMTNGYVMYGSVGPSVKGCYKSVVVPVMGSFAADFQAGNLGAEGLIAKGFVVKYNVETQVCKECTSTDERCGYDASANRTTCICAHGNAGFASCGYNETTGYSSSNGKGNTVIEQITISDQQYYLKGIDFEHYIITVDRKDKWTGFCPDSLVNTTIDYSIFNFPSSDKSITFFYDCDPSHDLSSLQLTTKCNLDGNVSVSGYYLTQDMLEDHTFLFQICKSNLFLPILRSDVEPSNLTDLIRAFQSGFELGFIAENEACDGCVGSGGECGYNLGSKNFVCYCADASYDTKCGGTSTSNKGRKNKISIIIGLSIGVVVLIAFVGGCLVFTHRSNLPQNHIIEDCLKNYASLVPKRYTYKYIKKITKSFREKLGEGGYGSVFKGNLQDGRAVAVKVWKQSKGDGQEFVNEVMSISGTSHVNVVPLLGFCFEGQKRALIYEFMPNGSLEKFLHGKNFDENNQILSSQKLLDIAIGIANGLEYLHRGCNTRIVHFDIKPHNILLDAEFTPKISDFGLAKSLKQKESIITMSGARGTAGYIAPEVILRSFGGVSHKSDVYSFGMMVLEMVGCKKRVNDHNVENSSEMYFPHWIYKQLERGATLDCESILNEEEKELERKMILVGLWCIQTNPLSRPAMSRVAEMLEGKVDLLEVPPMPTLASPPRQHQQQLTDNESSSFLSSTIYART